MHGCTNENWIKLLLKIDQVNKQGGPLQKDFQSLNALLINAHNEIKKGSVGATAVSQLRHALSHALTTDTIQGRGLKKKYGYSGDFEIIDDIYQHTVTSKADLKRWDEFFHAQSAPKAVRNRKDYFIQLVESLIKNPDIPFRILNVASGPCRDLHELFKRNPHVKNLKIDCIDADPFAIEYAKNVCQADLDKISFYHSNAFKFNTEHRYDLVWSAGLFDYFDDESFIVLLKHLKQFAKPHADIIIGNFSDDNPSQAYMELVGDWYLHYRDAETLVTLSYKAGINPKDVYVEKEVEGVNLFLRIKNNTALSP